MTVTNALAALLFACLLLLSTGTRVHAQDDPEPGWAFKAQLSTVWAGGNSESNTLGFRTTIKRLWEDASWSTSAGALRTQSSITTRRAVGSIDSFVIDEKTTTETTAEALFARTKLDQNVNEKIHVLGGVDWLRNTLSGVDSRFLLALGAGVSLSETKNVVAKADLSLTYTFEADVVDNPFSSDKFPGLRAGYNATYQVSHSTQLESELVGDWNLDNTDDIRIDWTNATSVAINSSLALKPSTLIQWRNSPALASVDLFDEGGESTGESVTVPLEKMDWFLNLAIVLTL
jgi:hypothetical protein